MARVMIRRLNGYNKGNLSLLWTFDKNQPVGFYSSQNNPTLGEYICGGLKLLKI
ncbi:MAG: hypothetical protein ACJA08_001229 [Cyclobacteriaceae bacterium]|jgi:hypothetical protein